jgi:hypothetical protein
LDAFGLVVNYGDVSEEEVTNAIKKIKYETETNSRPYGSGLKGLVKRYSFAIFDVIMEKETADEVIAKVNFLIYVSSS